MSVRIFALGGLDESGRNMYCVEMEQGIIAIDAGIRFPDSNQLGIEIIIPDFSYLEKNKDRFKGIVITHAHYDVMGAVPYLLKQMNVPIYTAPLTAELLERTLQKSGIKNPDIHRIKRSGEFVIGNIRMRSFGMTHSIADNFGLAIETDQGYVVFAGEFILENDNADPCYRCDIAELADIGHKGVLALMTESSCATQSGYTSPSHRVTGFIEPAMNEAPGRIIICAYSQNFSRIREIIELCAKLKKRVYFYNEDMKEMIRIQEDLGYYRLPEGVELPAASFSNSLDNIVILVTGQGHRAFRCMNRIAMKEDPTIELRPEDTVIVAAPIVAGTEIEAGIMENELYREDVTLVTMNPHTIKTVHASAEDLKTIMYLFKPKYYIPVKGQYRAMLANAHLATEMGIMPDKIVLLDNGQVAYFEKGNLKSCTQDIPLDEILIDGDDNLDVAGFVLKDRESLSTDGVIVIGIVCDFKTKRIIGGPDIQSRGVFYLKDADYIVKNIAVMMEDIIVSNVENGTYDNLKARVEAREKIQRYVLRETGKRPMILPAILEINVDPSGDY